MNLIDRLVGYFSPEAGYRRAVFRAELERNYTAARTDRFGQWWPSNSSAELTDAPSRDLIKARARDLERNNGIVEGAIGQIVRNAVGRGIKPQAIITDNKGNEKWRINDRIEDLWAEWTEKEHCELSHRMSFYDLQALYLRRLIVDGDIILIKSLNPDASAPFPLVTQIIENDFLANDLVQFGGNYIYGGVEVDDYMAPVAYHFQFDRDMTRKAVRTDASRVIHSFFIRRPQQVRGISTLTVTMEHIRDCGEFVESELKAARMAASLSGVIYSDQPSGGGLGRSMVQTEGGQTITAIEPGTMATLPTGQKAEFAQPGRPNGAAAPFISAMLRIIGMSIGMSYEALSRDLSQVNYSSAREGRLQDIKNYEIIQQFVINNLCTPIYNEWLDNMVLAGKINIPNYWQNKRKYQKCRWVTPGWKWVDPQKEASGLDTQLSLNLTTLQEACGSTGTDWQENVEQRAREEAYVRECRNRYGLPDTTKKKEGGGDNADNSDESGTSTGTGTSTNAGDNEDE